MVMKWASRGAVAALVCAALVVIVRAEQGSTPANPNDLANAFAQADPPGGAHAKLKPLAGSWIYTCRMWMEPGQPPIKTTGTIERRWILGGRFLEERYEGTGFDGKPGFEGFGLLGYDNHQQKYTYTWACNLGTGTSTGVGVFHKSGDLTLETTCHCPLLKTTIQGRDEIHIESADRIVTTSYHTIEGKEMKAMKIVAVRKK